MTEPAGNRVLFPPHYLPHTAWVMAALRFDEVWIDSTEKWQRKTSRNRTVIIGPNGLQTLTIPLEKSRRPGLTRDIRISYSQNWQRIHLGALESAYNSSPFFGYFREELFALYSPRPVFLLDFNLRLIHFLFERLGISGKLRIADESKALPSLSTALESNGCPFPAPYPQVFAERHGFLPDVSIIDLIANKGRL